MEQDQQQQHEGEAGNLPPVAVEQEPPPTNPVQQNKRPSSATTSNDKKDNTNTHQHHQSHTTPKDGHFATAKVFATPISINRPGSAPLSPPGGSSNGGRNHHLDHQRNNTSTTLFVVGGKGGKNINNNNNSSLPSLSPSNQVGSAGTLMRGPTTTNARNRPLSATSYSNSNNSSKNKSPTAQQSQLQMKGRSHWEHWNSNESPGRAASLAAKEYDDVYSGQPREEGKEIRRQIQIQQHEREYQQQQQLQNLELNNNGGFVHQQQPKISSLHVPLGKTGNNNNGKNSTSSLLGVKFPIRGRAVGGSATPSNRPSSAHSTTSSGRGSNNNNNTPRSNNFPPRKIITAELTALRRKYLQAAEANQRHQNNNYNSHEKRSTGLNNNNNNRQIRSQLDNIMNQIHSNGGVGTKVVDLGTGNPQNNYLPSATSARGGNSGRSHTSSSLRHPTIPAHIQIDNIARRAAETTKVMRREDQVAKENDRRIRNFRARALVQTATEMQRAKREEELNDINNKLVWEKMKRDALEGQIYDLKEKLEALKYGSCTNNNNNNNTSMNTSVISNSNNKASNNNNNNLMGLMTKVK